MGEGDGDGGRGEGVWFVLRGDVVVVWFGWEVYDVGLESYFGSWLRRNFLKIITRRCGLSN